MSEIINGLSESVKRKLKELLCDCKKRKNTAPTKGKDNFDVMNSIIEGLSSGGSGSDTKIAAIQNQENDLDKDSDTLIRNIDRNNREADYQKNIYDTLSKINSVLFILYVIMFLFASGVILKQHIDGIERDEYKDGVIVVIFMLFPFLSYQLELWIWYLMTKIYHIVYVGFYYLILLHQSSL